MKKKAFHIFFLFLFSLAAFSSVAQSWNREFSFDMNYTGLPHNDKMRNAMNLMADNNGVSVLGLRLHISYLAELSLTRSKAGIPVLRYKVRLQAVSGDTKFHGFNIDTLLVPTRLVAVIRVYQNQKLLDSLIQPLVLHREQILLPVSGRVPLSSLYVTFRMVQVEFTEADYQKLIRTTNEINAYYGYRQIIKELPQILLKTNDIHPEASALFYNYVVLTRLANHIETHHFTRRLHLNRKDPLHFRKAYASLLRKQTRMKTLSEAVVENGNPAQIMQKVAFARSYAGLSMNVVALSKQHQPYISGSFREYSRIFPHSPEMQIVGLASRYFDKSDKPGQATVKQEIYKDFLAGASFYLRKQAYVSTLDMLANAACFENTFREVKRIPEFNRLLTAARDGLAYSYFSVAQNAFSHRDTQLAHNYLQKSIRSLHAYDTLIAPAAHAVCYKQFSKGMLGMARGSMERGQIHQAFSFLVEAQAACPGQAQTDSLQKELCHRMLVRRVRLTERLLQEQAIRAAYDTLVTFRSIFQHYCHDSLSLQNNPGVKRLASEIFQQLLVQAEHFHRQKEEQEAMLFLNLSGGLQQRFSLPPSPLRHTLIKNTTVPYILSVADKVDLAVWKKDFRQADSIYRVAKSLSRRYGVWANPAVNRELKGLAKKIEEAGCRWHLEQTDYLLSQTRQAVISYHLDKAQSLFLKAKAHYAQAQNCGDKRQATVSLFSSYEKLFRFTDAYRKLTRQLFSQGFATVLPHFVQLENLYRRERLAQYGLPFTGVYAFVRNQHSDQLSMEAVHFYLQKRDFENALKYLMLVTHPAQAKAEQKQIAAGFVEKNRVPDRKILKNPAFSVFAKTYWKVLAAK